MVTKTYLILIILTLLFSCKKEENKEKEEHNFEKDTFSDVFQKIAINYKHVFRGHDLKTPKSKIKEDETATLIEEQDSLLQYNLLLDEGKQHNLIVEYKFNEENLLSSIYATITVHDNITFEALLGELIEYFEHKYGLPSAFNEMGEEVWKIENHIEHGISILDEVVEEDYTIKIRIE